MPDPVRAEANRAHVRRLLADKEPAFAAYLAHAVAALDAEMAQGGRGPGQEPGGPGGTQPDDRHRPRPPGNLAAAWRGRLNGPHRPHPEPDIEAGL
jgi:hypothetical protein